MYGQKIIFAALVLATVAASNASGFDDAVLMPDRQRGAQSSAWDVAAADYATLSDEDQRHTRYLSLAAVPQQEQAEIVLRFLLPHLSGQVVLDRQRPVHVAGDVWRIDLDGLGWTLNAWHALSAEYPYEAPLLKTFLVSPRSLQEEQAALSNKGKPGAEQKTKQQAPQRSAPAYSEQTVVDVELSGQISKTNVAGLRTWLAEDASRGRYRARFLVSPQSGTGQNAGWSTAEEILATVDRANSPEAATEAAQQNIPATNGSEFDKQAVVAIPASGAPKDALIIRGDWLVWITADAENSAAYYNLLYGGKTPKTREEFFTFWRVSLKDSDGFEQASIADEGTSGVAFRTRLMVARFTSAGGYAWETFDSEQTTGKSDPLEVLGPLKQKAGDLQFDAGEQIVGIPKIDLASGERGVAQVYLLTNGKGEIVNEADPRVVHDSVDDIPVIRTPGSCIRCHGPGINSPPANLVRELISDGVELATKKKDDAEAVDAQFLGKLEARIERDQELFAAFVRLACGAEATPQAVVAEYRKLVGWYDARVDLEQAARELSDAFTGVTADEVRLALAAYSDTLGPAAVARLAGLAHGRGTPRRNWEADTYSQAYKALQLWRAKP